MSEKTLTELVTENNILKEELENKDKRIKELQELLAKYIAKEIIRLS